MIFVDSSVWIDYFNGRKIPQTLKSKISPFGRNDKTGLRNLVQKA